MERAFFGVFGRVAGRAVAVVLAAVVLAGGVVLAASAAAGDCPDLPTVPWWKNLSHESLRRVVAKKHHGDWNAYIEFWKKNRAFANGVLERGNALRVGRERIRLTGSMLRDYVLQIDQRIAVTECLAEAAARAGESNGTDSRAVADMDTASGPVRDPLDKASVDRGRRAAMTENCKKCHGIDGMGVGPFDPNLAGQKKRYLYTQMLMFQSGARGESLDGTAERRHDIVSHKLEHLPGQSLADLAAYYSVLRPVVDDKKQ